MLTALPAGDGFTIFFSDLQAHRDAVGVTLPPADAPAQDLIAHSATLTLSGDTPWRPVAQHETDASLLPLVRGSAYVIDRSRNTDVFAGAFTPDTFGRLTPDEVLEGVDTLAVPGMFGTTTGAGRLTVDDSIVTFATTPDHMAAALDAQHGDVHTLADVAEAVELVSALDDLDVIHGQATRSGASKLTDGDAWGVSADPDTPGSWRLHVLYRPSGDGGVDRLIAAVTKRASAAAGEHGAEVVDVAPHDGLVLVTIRFAEPDAWFGIGQPLAALFWDDPDLGGGCATELSHRDAGSA